MTYELVNELDDDGRRHGRRHDVVERLVERRRCHNGGGSGANDERVRVRRRRAHVQGARGGGVRRVVVTELEMSVRE